VASGTWVVTGGTDGIGHATALHLARAGFPVIFTGRSRTKAESALSELRGAGPGLPHAFVEADFSLMTQVRRAADEILAQAPRIRGLVHCAGIAAGAFTGAPLDLDAIDAEIGSVFGHTAEVSARTPFLLASAPSTRPLSGHYVGPSIRTLPRIPQVAKDPALRGRLWEVSEKLVRDQL
jgi:NAD(P)-dependent dehydrogenase (short-subunit alcohol dehydrogenase family)